MNPFQQWLDDKALQVLTWLWELLSTLLYWICANGILISVLIFIMCKSQKSLHWTITFFISFLLIFIIKCAIANS